MMITNLFRLLCLRYSVAQQYLEGYWMFWWRSAVLPENDKATNPYQQKVLNLLKGCLPSFRQEGSRFYEESPDLLKIVEAEFVDIGYGEKIVTIYFGIQVPELHKLAGREELMKPSRVGDCIFLCNINEVAQDFKSPPARRYWTLGGYSRSAYRQIKRIMRESVWPLAIRLDSLLAVNDFIDSIHHASKELPHFAVQQLLLKYLTNKDDQVRRIANELIARDAVYFGPRLSMLNRNLAKLGLKPITKD